MRIEKTEFLQVVESLADTFSSSGERIHDAVDEFDDKWKGDSKELLDSADIEQFFQATMGILVMPETLLRSLSRKTNGRH